MAGHFFRQNRVLFSRVSLRVPGLADPYIRAHYIASVYAARIMVPNGTGLIVNMSSSGGIMHMASAAYGIGKAAKDRMAQDLNKELDGTGSDPRTVRVRRS